MTLFGKTMAALVALSLAAGLPAARAQSPGKMIPAMVTATASPTTVGHGGHGKLTITLAIKPLFTVNAHKTNDPDLIAANFVPAATAGVRYGAAHYPASHSARVGGETELVYTGRVQIVVPFTVAPTAKPGRLTLGGTFTYQGCQSALGVCAPPRDTPVKASVVVR